MSGFTKCKEVLVSRGVLIVLAMEAVVVGLVVLSIVYPELSIR